MKEIRARIKRNLKKVNQLCGSLRFELTEGDGGCAVENHSTAKGCEGNSFGIFSYRTAAESDKEAAYQECDAFLSGLLAGTRLLDGEAYHNLIVQENQWE